MAKDVYESPNFSIAGMVDFFNARLMMQLPYPKCDLPKPYKGLPSRWPPGAGKAWRKASADRCLELFADAVDATNVSDALIESTFDAFFAFLDEETP